MAFKKPSCNKQVLKHLKKFQLPLVVHITRDPIAIAIRTSHVYQRDFRGEVDKVLKHQAELTRRINKLKCPVLYCSYEKALLNLERFIQELLRVTGIECVDKEQYQRVLRSIRPEPEGYVAACVPHRPVRGYIDYIRGNRIGGWAAFRKDDRFVTVQVFVDGTLAAIEECNSFRQDLKNAGVHPEGRCAFEALVDEGVDLKKENIKVIVADENMELEYSSGCDFV